MKRRIILAGGSGFLGRLLAAHFLKENWEVVVLTRQPKPRTAGVREVAWDGETVGAWAAELDGATALINLAGRSVDCRYTAANRRLIMDSRVNPTRALGAAVARCVRPPRVWLNSSTATIYRHTFGPAWDESGEIGATREAQDEFSIEVATAWEREFNEAATPRTRMVLLRSAMVLGRGANSVFPVLRRLVRFGLGGRMGSGRQFVSWIHAEDFCRAIEFLIAHDELSGPVNLAAPNPLPNAEMMRVMRGVCGVPFGLPAAEWMLEAGAFFLRTETELIIKSRRVVPGKMSAEGFEFRFSHFRAAADDLSAKLAE
ncbi:MAG: TIGR01777 family protein [Verrucomicrobia bacterium]|nr:TIGR01777 family protein [Verrucomicrobiota bacterium]